MKYYENNGDLIVKLGVAQQNTQNREFTSPKMVDASYYRTVNQSTTPSYPFFLYD